MAEIVENYFLRWRIFERIRRFFRPNFRRPLPVFFVPTHYSVSEFNQPMKIDNTLAPPGKKSGQDKQQPKPINGSQ
jgi:hypothetical protein